jgi:hypothetical protein
MELSNVVLPAPPIRPADRIWASGGRTLGQRRHKEVVKSSATAARETDEVDQEAVVQESENEVAELRKEIADLKNEYGTKKLVGDVAGGLVLEEVGRRGWDKLKSTKRGAKAITKVKGVGESITAILKSAGARIKGAGGAALKGIGKAGGVLLGGLRLLVTAAGLKVMAVILGLAYVARLAKRLYDYKKKGLPPGMTGKQFFYNSLIPFKGLPAAANGQVAKAILSEPSFNKQMGQLPDGAGDEIREEIKKVSKIKGGKLNKADREKLAGLTIQRASEAGIKVKPSKEGLSVTASSILVA